MNRKADGGLTAIVIIVVVIVFLCWLVNVGGRECQSNKECTDEQYCGSDFACHKIPVIVKENTPIIMNRNYMGPAWIIGIAIVIAAVLFNLDKIVPRRQVEKYHEPREFPVYYEKHNSK